MERRREYLAAARRNLMVALTTDDPVVARVCFRMAIEYDTRSRDVGASRSAE